jgi:hypothetical protein
MPRYYFDTHDGETSIADEHGLILAGLEEAKAEAIKALPDMARDVLPDADCREYRA